MFTLQEEEEQKQEVTEEVYSVITNYEILFVINQIYPTESEIKEITSTIHQEEVQTFSQEDTLILTLCLYPKFKKYIDFILTLYDIQTDIVELCEFYTDLYNVIHFLTHSQKVQFIIEIVLALANCINQENGAKLIENCDFSSLSKVLDMKNNNMCIFDLIYKYYTEIFGSEFFLSTEERNWISSVSGKLEMLKDGNSKEKQYLGIFNDLINSLSNESIKLKLKENFYNDFYLKVVVEEFQILKKKKNDSITLFSQYFEVNENKFIESLKDVLEVVNKLEVKLRKYVLECKNLIRKENPGQEDKKDREVVKCPQEIPKGNAEVLGTPREMEKGGLQPPGKDKEIYILKQEKKKQQ